MVILTLGFRYALVVNSPIVAKIDRLTGDVWVANPGVWLKVNHVAKEKRPSRTKAPVVTTANKTVQKNTK
ncbi:MAG: hypothetical protein ABH875_01085 [Candidatus Omnitrophota bacterium]